MAPTGPPRVFRARLCDEALADFERTIARWHPTFAHMDGGSFPCGPIFRLPANCTRRTRSDLARVWEEAAAVFDVDYTHIEVCDIRLHRPGSRIDKHTDHYLPYLAPHVLSMSLPLSDGHSGGELVLHTDRPYVVTQRAGEAIVFESHVEHEVMPLTAGERYVFISRICDGPVPGRTLFTRDLTGRKLQEPTAAEIRDTKQYFARLRKHTVGPDAPSPPSDLTDAAVIE